MSVIHCQNDTETAAAYDRARREGLKVWQAQVMPKNRAGWILYVSDPPEQRELLPERTSRNPIQTRPIIKSDDTAIVY